MAKLFYPNTLLCFQDFRIIDPPAAGNIEKFHCPEKCLLDRINKIYRIYRITGEYRVC